jgi:hypothetical protein
MRARTFSLIARLGFGLPRAFFSPFSQPIPKTNRISYPILYVWVIHTLNSFLTLRHECRIHCLRVMLSHPASPQNTVDQNSVDNQNTVSPHLPYSPPSISPPPTLLCTTLTKHILLLLSPNMHPYRAVRDTHKVCSRNRTVRLPPCHCRLFDYQWRPAVKAMQHPRIPSPPHTWSLLQLLDGDSELTLTNKFRITMRNARMTTCYCPGYLHPHRAQTVAGLFPSPGSPPPPPRLLRRLASSFWKSSRSVHRHTPQHSMKTKRLSENSSVRRTTLVVVANNDGVGDVDKTCAPPVSTAVSNGSQAGLQGQHKATKPTENQSR